MIKLDHITIVSGGQTGADRAALDFAIEHGLQHDGWCPRGRRAEDGCLPPRYNLRETPSRHYSQRTRWNVRDSDATVIFTLSPAAIGGTRLTIQFAERLAKPWLQLSRSSADDASTNQPTPASHSSSGDCAERLLAFLEKHRVRRLNVAGPRASQEPEIARFVHDVLRHALG